MQDFLDNLSLIKPKPAAGLLRKKCFQLLTKGKSQVRILILGDTSAGKTAYVYGLGRTTQRLRPYWEAGVPTREFLEFQKKIGEMVNVEGKVEWKPTMLQQELYARAKAQGMPEDDKAQMAKKDYFPLFHMKRIGTGIHQTTWTELMLSKLFPSLDEVEVCAYDYVGEATLGLITTNENQGTKSPLAQETEWFKENLKNCDAIICCVRATGDEPSQLARRTIDQVMHLIPNYRKGQSYTVPIAITLTGVDDLETTRYADIQDKFTRLLREIRSHYHARPNKPIDEFLPTIFSEMKEKAKDWLNVWSKDNQFTGNAEQFGREAGLTILPTSAFGVDPEGRPLAERRKAENGREQVFVKEVFPIGVEWPLLAVAEMGRVLNIAALKWGFRLLCAALIVASILGFITWDQISHYASKHAFLKLPPDAPTELVVQVGNASARWTGNPIRVPAGRSDLVITDDESRIELFRTNVVLTARITNNIPIKFAWRPAYCELFLTSNSIIPGASLQVVFFERGQPTRTNELVPVAVSDGTGKWKTLPFSVPRDQSEAVLRSRLRADSRMTVEGYPGKTNHLAIELRPLVGVAESRNVPSGPLPDGHLIENAVTRIQEPKVTNPTVQLAAFAPLSPASPTASSSPLSTGWVELRSVPENQSFQIGTPPLLTNVTSPVLLGPFLSKSAVSFAVYKDHFFSQDVTVTVEPGKTNQFSINLSPATLSIHCTPSGATISRDQKVLGQAFPTLELTNESPGENTYCATLDGYGMASTNLTLAAGSHKTVALVLPGGWKAAHSEVVSAKRALREYGITNRWPNLQRALTHFSFNQNPVRYGTTGTGLVDLPAPVASEVAEAKSLLDDYTRARNSILHSQGRKAEASSVLFSPLRDDLIHLALNGESRSAISDLTRVYARAQDQTSARELLIGASLAEMELDVAPLDYLQSSLMEADAAFATNPEPLSPWRSDLEQAKVLLLSRVLDSIQTQADNGQLIGIGKEFASYAWILSTADGENKARLSYLLTRVNTLAHERGFNELVAAFESASNGYYEPLRILTKIQTRLSSSIEKADASRLREFILRCDERYLRSRLTDIRAHSTVGEANKFSRDKGRPVILVLRSWEQELSEMTNRYSETFRFTNTNGLNGRRLSDLWSNDFNQVQLTKTYYEKQH